MKTILKQIKQQNFLSKFNKLKKLLDSFRIDQRVNDVLDYTLIDTDPDCFEYQDEMLKEFYNVSLQEMIEEKETELNKLKNIKSQFQNMFNGYL